MKSVKDLLQPPKSPEPAKGGVSHLIRAHWKKFGPKCVKQLRKEGRYEEFFQSLERQADQMWAELKDKLPPGGAEEVLRDAFFPPSLAEEEYLERLRNP